MVFWVNYHKYKYFERDVKIVYAILIFKVFHVRLRGTGSMMLLETYQR